MIKLSIFYRAIFILIWVKREGFLPFYDLIHPSQRRLLHNVRLESTGSQSFAAIIGKIVVSNVVTKQLMSALFLHVINSVKNNDNNE